MTFRYVNEWLGSLKLSFKNPGIFWAILLTSVIMETLTTGISLAFMGTGEPNGAFMASYVISQIFIFIITLLFSIYLVSAMATSTRKVVVEGKATFKDFFRLAKTKFGDFAGLIGLSYAAYIAFAFVFGFIVVIFALLYQFAEFNTMLVVMIIFFSLAIMLLLLYFVYRLIFVVPAIADNLGLINSIKYSWKYPDKTHQKKTFTTNVLFGILALLLYIPLIIFYINIFSTAGDMEPNKALLLGGIGVITYVIILTLFMLFYSIANYIFLYKAYSSKTLKRAK